MRLSDKGVFALALHEGLVPAPYLDSAGVWTFGIGHTAAAGKPDPATLPRGNPADLDRGIRRAFEVFRADLPKYEAAVARAVRVPLAQHEFDALVSFHYNTGAIARASLTKRLNAGDRAAAAAGFMNWTRPSALRKRREAERDLFLHGIYPAGTVPVFAVTTGNKPDFRRVLRRLSLGDVVLALGRPVPAAPTSGPVAPAAPSSQVSAPETQKGFWAALWRALLGIVREK